jgi:uncharacterized protein
MAAGAGVAAIAADSILLEPNRPRIVRQEVALRRWPEAMDGFSIVLLSDFHYDDHFSAHPLKAAIGMVNDLRPKLILLAGDFVSLPLLGGTDERTAAQAAAPCAALLRQMRAPHGLWAVLGNHDFFTDPELVTGALREQGIAVLANQSTAIETKTGRFWLGGVNDVFSGTADVKAAFQERPGGEPAVLLAHEPDFADFVARHDVDLQLSGHSHGGQVRLPFLGPLYLPALGRKYVSGLYRVGELAVYTNPGLGTVGLPVRWNCPPEITFLTLRAARA